MSLGVFWCVLCCVSCCLLIGVGWLRFFWAMFTRYAAVVAVIVCCSFWVLFFLCVWFNVFVGVCVLLLCFCFDVVGLCSRFV